MPDWKGFLEERLLTPGMTDLRDERMMSELADHLEDLYLAALSHGLGEEEAEAVVIEALGDTDLAASELERVEPARFRAAMARWTEAREEDLRSRGGLGTVLADRVQDLRMAGRALARRPFFTAAVVGVLALGIGATTAIFTVLDAVVLSPLPFEEPDRLVDINHTGESIGIRNCGQCAAWHFTYEEEGRVFEDVGMYYAASATVIDRGVPESVTALGLTSGVLSALRIRPVVGRLLGPEDEVVEAPFGVLLGFGYWQSRFGGDRRVVGQLIEFEGRTVEVVGVVSPILSSLGADPAIVYPFRFDRTTLFVGDIGARGVARLKSGVTLEQANADAARLLPLASEKFPGGPIVDFNKRANFVPNIRPLKDVLVGPVANTLWMLVAGVGIMLLIAIANVANLFLVRADSKRTEMFVRSALGAGRGRISWEYLKEGVLLGVAGGGAGLVLASAGVRALVAMAPNGLPRVDEVSANAEVLLFTLSVSLGAGVLVGFAPLLRHGPGRLMEALKHRGRTGSDAGSSHHIQRALAVGQVALALVLLVASGLVLRSFLTLRNVEPGFEASGDVVAFRLSLPPAEGTDGADAAATHERIVRRLERVPGVVSVGMGTSIPMHGFRDVNPFYVEGRVDARDSLPPMYRHKWIGEGFLETLGIPLVAGRSLTWQDAHDRAPVVLVSESLAQKYWGSAEAALGKRVAARPDPPWWYEVVGVVADVRDDGLAADPLPTLYWPQVTLAFWEGDPDDQVTAWLGASYAVKSPRVGSEAFLDDLREAVWEVDPRLPLLRVATLDDLAARSIARTSFTLTLLGIAAGVALVLGLIGVYGVTSYVVSRRTSEMGIRMALGARGEDLAVMVLRQGFILCIVGLGIGLALAFGLTRVMSGLLFGVSPWDPVTFVLVSLTLLVVTLAASYLPARRAARVDPMTALRAE